MYGKPMVVTSNIIPLMSFGLFSFCHVHEVHSLRKLRTKT